MATTTPPIAPPAPLVARSEAVVIRFAGDSADAHADHRSQFMVETALAGIDLATFPDFPPRSARRPGRPSASRHSRSFRRDRLFSPRDELDVWWR